MSQNTSLFSYILYAMHSNMDTVVKSLESVVFPVLQYKSLVGIRAQRVNFIGPEVCMSASQILEW